MKGDFVMGKLREKMKMDLELQSPQQVLEYLGRYTHRVAISNHHMAKIEDGKVTFKWTILSELCNANGKTGRFWHQCR